MKLKLQQPQTVPHPFLMDSNSFRPRALKKRKASWRPISSLQSNESPLTPESKRVHRIDCAITRKARKIGLNSIALTAFSTRLTEVLAHLCRHNDNKPNCNTRKIVSAVVADALKTRFGKPETLISGLILLDRVQTSSDGILVTTKTVRIMYGICVLLAGKFLTDGSVWNYEAHELLGSSMGVNEIERRVLEIMRWRVWIGREEYVKYRSAVIGQ